jgi:hypothetical protein
MAVAIVTSGEKAEALPKADKDGLENCHNSNGGSHFVDLPTTRNVVRDSSEASIANSPRDLPAGYFLSGRD